MPRLGRTSSPAKPAVRSSETRRKILAALTEDNPARGAVAEASVVIVVLGVPEEGEIHQGKPFYLVDCGVAGRESLSAGGGVGSGPRCGCPLSGSMDPPCVEPWELLPAGSVWVCSPSLSARGRSNNRKRLFPVRASAQSTEVCFRTGWEIHSPSRGGCRRRRSRG